MGICYSQQEQWDACHKQIRERRGHRKKKKTASIIVEENTMYQDSFASKVINSFRDDIHGSLQNIASQIGSIAIGSIVEMNEQEIKILQQSLIRINPDGQHHNLQEVVTLCNLKTKNFLHTHKVSYPDLPKVQQVSCCPYNSNHIIEYDIWKFIKAPQESMESIDSETNQSVHENFENYFIYHPFTQRFLNFVKGHIVCTQEKMAWKIMSFGPRRNGGFVKIQCDQGQLCMTDQRGLLTNHRRLQVCRNKHISHLWQIQFGQII